MIRTVVFTGVTVGEDVLVDVLVVVLTEVSVVSGVIVDVVVVLVDEVGKLVVF